MKIVSDSSLPALLKLRLQLPRAGAVSLPWSGPNGQPPESSHLASDLRGQASVVDGDTLEIHGARIRLWRVDAPESSQLCRGEGSLTYCCGAKAANELEAFIARRPVNCEL
jgi:endonuclease YncB( thermonuclease family)